MVDERREKRRQFFGPYGNPANWQTAQTATPQAAAPVTAAARQYPFTGDKRAAAASVAQATAPQQLPTMVNAAQPERTFPFVGAKRAEAQSLGVPTGPSVQLPPRQQPDPKRTYPFIGKKRPEGWVPDTWKAPPQEAPLATQGRGLMDTNTEAPLDWANNPEAMPPSRPQEPPSSAQGRGLMDTNMEKQHQFAPQEDQPIQSGTPGQPDSGQITPNLSPRDKQIRQNMGQIDAILASGKQFDGRTMAKIQQMRQQAGFLRGGTDRVAVGPDGLPIRQPQQTTQQRLAAMDPNQNIRANSDGYSFEGAAGDAQRFFAPTGKGDPEAERNWAIAEQQRRARQPPPRVFRGGQQQPDPNLDPRSGWGWKGRQRVAEMGQDAAQSAEKMRLEQQKLAMTGQESAADRALSRQQMTMEDARGVERNAIDRKNTESQMAERQFSLTERQQISALQKRFMESTDPAEKKQLQESLKVLGAIKEPEAKVFMNQEGDPMNPVDVPYILQGGQVRPAMGGQQDQQTDIPTKDQVTDGYKKNINGVPHVWSKKQGGFVPAGN